MNLLLLQADEIAEDGTVVLRDRRGRHVREVLRAEVGQVLRAGVVDGALGTAELLRADGDGAVLRWQVTGAAPAESDDVLLLAIARPKVLMRMLAHAAALGFGRVVLFRSWRVDKSHLDSKAMQAGVQRQCLLAGLEQSCRTRLPRVQTFLLFKPFVEDELERLELPAQRFCAHPAAALRTAAVRVAKAPLALAIGPEGGLLPYEVDMLAQRGFTGLSLGPHPLRTETALAVLHGQLDLLRQRG